MPSIDAKQHWRRAGYANCAPLLHGARTRTPPSLTCPHGSSAVLAPHRRRAAAGRDPGPRPQQDPAAAPLARPPGVCLGISAPTFDAKPDPCASDEKRHLRRAGERRPAPPPEAPSSVGHHCDSPPGRRARPGSWPAFARQCWSRIESRSPSAENCLYGSVESRWDCCGRSARRSSPVTPRAGSHEAPQSSVAVECSGARGEGASCKPPFAASSAACHGRAGPHVPRHCGVHEATGRRVPRDGDAPV